MKYKVPAERFSSWSGGDMKEILYADAQKYIAEVRVELKELSDMSAEERYRVEDLKRFTRMDSRNRFESLTSRLSGEYGLHCGKYPDFIKKKIQEGAADDDPQIKLLTDQFIEFGMFSQSMSFLRKLWMPQTGKGGQDREYTIHRYLGQVIADFSDKKIKAWEAEYGEEEEEEDAPEAQ